MTMFRVQIKELNCVQIKNATISVCDEHEYDEKQLRRTSVRRKNIRRKTCDDMLCDEKRLRRTGVDPKLRIESSNQ